MNAKNFSEALNDIDDRYLQEAINYSRDRRVFPLYKKISAFAAVFIFLIASAVAVVNLTGSSPKVYIGERLVTGEEQIVQGTQRGISLASETESVSVTLGVKIRKTAGITVSDGFVSEGFSSGDKQRISVRGATEITWSVDPASKEDAFTLEIVSSDEKIVLKLNFSKEKNSWVISKS